MTPVHVVADLAAARRKSLLAEAEAYRRVGRARAAPERHPGIPATRRSPLRRVLNLLTEEP
jgi:hypothetical protein